MNTQDMTNFTQARLNLTDLPIFIPLFILPTTNPPHGMLFFSRKEEKGVEKESLEPEEICQAAICFIMNIFLLSCVVARKNLRKRKTHQLFLNVTVVHILSGIAIIVSNLRSIKHHKINIIITNGLVIETFESLMFMTCERVIALKFHFKYADVKTRHVLLLLAFSWIPPAVYVIVAILYDVKQETCLIVNTVTVLIAGAVLGVSNVIVYNIAKKHEKFLNKNSSGDRPLKKKNKTLKASFVCLAVVSSFILLWAPYVVHNILWLASVVVNDDIFTKAVDHIAYLHGIVDPILFIWLSASTKKELMVIFNSLRWEKGKKRQSKQPMTETMSEANV